MRRRAAALLLCLAAAPAAAQEIAGSWRGTYTCGQGNTALTLTIAALDKERVSALFHFEAAPDNPGVPSGCFEMSGRFDARTGRLALAPGFWIARPQGYEMVGLEGQLGADGMAMSGRVDHPTCTSFQLVRRVIPNAIAACRGIRPG